MDKSDISSGLIVYLSQYVDEQEYFITNQQKPHLQLFNFAVKNYLEKLHKELQYKFEYETGIVLQLKYFDIKIKVTSESNSILKRVKNLIKKNICSLIDIETESEEAISQVIEANMKSEDKNFIVSKVDLIPEAIKQLHEQIISDYVHINCDVRS